MAKIEEILAKMQNNPSGIRYHDLCKVCDNFLVKHVKSAVATVFTRTLWPGDPRVNIQNKKGMAESLSSSSSSESYPINGEFR